MSRDRWFVPGWPRARLWGHLVWFGAWAAATIGALIVSPSPHGHGTHQQLGLPPCPSVAVFGRPCPGCGLTTSFAHAVRGDFAESFAAHAFGPILYLAWMATALACLIGWLRGMRFETSTRPWTVGTMVLTIAFFAYGALRFATTRATLNPEPPALRLPLPIATE